MKGRNFLLIAAVLVITLASLVFAPAVDIEADGEKAEAFAGADGKAQEAIGTLAPDYVPWFAPLLEPAGGEVESLLFALQAALGAGVIGYWLGAAVTRERYRSAEKTVPENPAQQATQPPSQRSAHVD